MRLKQIPEDFVVKEIPSAKPLGQGEYVWCTLKKKNWDLLKLLKEISTRLQVSRTRIGYAGIKDKAALTYQTISFWNVAVQKLRDLKIKDVEFSDFEYNQRAIKLGDLKGNWFSITVRDLEQKYTKELVGKSVEAIGKNGCINLFDSQRFGTRNITHLVGKEIIRGRVAEAVFLYLTKTNKGEALETAKVRKLLAETEDFRRAVQIFPRESKWDITILNHLIQKPEDYLGALRSLPRTLQLMFIHAYQSHIWNQCALELAKKFPGKNFQIPMVGWNTKLGNSEVDKVCKKILNKEKTRIEDFRIKEIPELTSSGSRRDLLIYPENLVFRMEKDELNKGKNKAVLEFSLPKGSYGTQVIKEIFN